MILADTSVWIDYFNGVNNAEASILDASLYEGNVIIGDLILLEILQGFRNDRDYNKARKMLSPLEQYEMFGKDMVHLCANNYRSLRKKGITIRKTADVIIATFCIEKQIPLLFSDRDFLPFTKYLNLISASAEI